MIPARKRTSWIMEPWQCIFQYLYIYMKCLLSVLCYIQFRFSSFFYFFLCNCFFQYTKWSPKSQIPCALWPYSHGPVHYATINVSFKLSDKEHQFLLTKVHCLWYISNLILHYLHTSNTNNTPMNSEEIFTSKHHYFPHSTCSKSF